MRKIYSFILFSILLVSCGLTATEKPLTASPLPTGTHTTTPLPIASTPTLSDTPTRTLTPTLTLTFTPSDTPTNTFTPTNTPTATFTPTFTPSSTPTSPTETVTPTLFSPCQTTPTPYVESGQSMLGIWRVRHDVERVEWNCRSRLWFDGWKKLRGLPETVRVHGGKGTIFLSDRWVDFLDSINTQDAQRFLRIEHTGWLNHGPFPIMEQLTFGGNYVMVTRIDGHKAYIKTFNNGDHPPSASDPIIGNNTLIQTFSVVYTDGSWEMATPAGLVHTLLIANSRDGELWIDIDNLIRP